MQRQATLLLDFMAGNTDVAAHQSTGHARGWRRNSREQRAVATYFHLVTTEIGWGQAHGILQIAVVWESWKLDMNPDRTTDMRRLLQRERGHFKAEMHLDSGAAPALVHYAQRRGSVFWCLLRHLEVDLALLDI
jgi:hypothetical protein